VPVPGIRPRTPDVSLQNGFSSRSSACTQNCSTRWGTSTACLFSSSGSLLYLGTSRNFPGVFVQSEISDLLFDRSYEDSRDTSTIFRCLKRSWQRENWERGGTRRWVRMRRWETLEIGYRFSLRFCCSQKMFRIFFFFFPLVVDMVQMRVYT